MGIRALLYDAKGDNSDIELTRRAVTGLRDDQLLWVDVERPERGDLDLLGDAFAFPPPIMRALEKPGEEERLVCSPEAILLTVVSVEEREGRHAALPVDIAATRNAVVTVHARPVPALAEFEAHVSDEGALGRLDAGSFMGGLVDTMLGSFRREVEEIEEQVDRLDEVALRGNDPGHFLERVVALRRRPPTLRRILVPQRETFGPLTRPDFDLHEDPRPALARPGRAARERRSPASNARASCWLGHRTSTSVGSVSAQTTS